MARSRRRRGGGRRRAGAEAAPVEGAAQQPAGSTAGAKQQGGPRHTGSRTGPKQQAGAAGAKQGPQDGARRSGGRRRRRRSGGARSSEPSVLEQMADRGPRILQTLPPDGVVAEEIIDDMREEYVYPATPQEYRLIVRVAAEDPASQNDGVRRRESAES